MERSQFLQLMRFVAAALVLCTHATFYYHERIGGQVSVWHFGEVGVPIFFVISGMVMVIATQDLPRDAASARVFMQRRIIRIVPLYWIATASKVVVALARPDVVNHNHFRIDHALMSFLFIPYFNEVHAVSPLHAVGWTLLHEMFFYVLFSLALFLRQRPAALASAAIVLLWLAGTQVHVNNAFWVVATSEVNLQFVIGMGVGTMLVMPPGRALARGPAAMALGVLAAVILLLPARLTVHPGYGVVLAFGAAALWLANTRLPAAVAPVARLGDSSYSLYLFHPFIAPAALLTLDLVLPGMDAALHITIAIVLTVALAHALHLVVEVPVVRMARRRLLAYGDRRGKNLVSRSS